MLVSPPEARYRQERVRELQRQKLILAAPAAFSSELSLYRGSYNGDSSAFRF